MLNTKDFGSGLDFVISKSTRRQPALFVRQPIILFFIKFILENRHSLLLMFLNNRKSPGIVFRMVRSSPSALLFIIPNNRLFSTIPESCLKSTNFRVPMELDWKSISRVSTSCELTSPRVLNSIYRTGFYRDIK